MEKQKNIYEVIIKQNGEIVNQIKTDCIMASINDLENNGTQVIGIMSCTGRTMATTYAGLKNVEKKIKKENPLIGLIDIINNVRQ